MRIIDDCYTGCHINCDYMYYNNDFKSPICRGNVSDSCMSVDHSVEIQDINDTKITLNRCTVTVVRLFIIYVELQRVDQEKTIVDNEHHEEDNYIDTNDAVSSDIIPCVKHFL